MQFAWQIADGMSYLCAIKVREESLFCLFWSVFNAKTYIRIEWRNEKTKDRTIFVNLADDDQYSIENIGFV